jgi:hypothetical protein
MSKAVVATQSRGVRQYLDKGDANSTSNMHKHAKRCWGAETITSADNANNANDVHDTTIKGILNPQMITAAFERQGKDKVTFSHRQHMKTESRAEIGALYTEPQVRVESLGVHLHSTRTLGGVQAESTQSPPGVHEESLQVHKKSRRSPQGVQPEHIRSSPGVLTYS